MRTNKNDLPVKLGVPGVTVRMQPGFGGNGAALAAEWLSLAAGADTAPLLADRNEGVCEVEHWGYLESGALVVTYADGSEEHCGAGDLFHWPSGHNVRIAEAAEIFIFSPHAAEDAVLDYVLTKVSA